ncbi:hypothetical protein V3481_017134 [Fusarium oxysporum f. sp. vasinfectum]
MIFVCGVFVATPRKNRSSRDEKSISKDHESRLEQRTDTAACVTFWAFSLDPCECKVRNGGWRKGSSCRVRENGMQPWLAGMGTCW